MKQRQRTIFGLGISALIGAGFAITAMAHNGATGIVKERMDLFSRNKDHLKAIKAHFAADDLPAIIPLAEQIRDFAADMPSYFPEGSDEAESEAAPEIWVDFDGFTAAAAQNFTAADNLVKAAMAGDKTGAMTAFQATAASCKSCHKSFRID